MLRQVARDERAAAKHLPERLHIANTLINLAHEHANELRRQLARLPPDPSQTQREAVVRRWVAELGRPRGLDRVLLGVESAAAAADAAAADASPTRDEPSAAAESSAAESRVLAVWSLRPPSVANMGKWQRRWALLKYEARRRRRHVQSELARRSEVFRRLFLPPAHAADRRGRRDSRNSRLLAPAPACGALGDSALMAVALGALGVVVLTALPAAAVLLVLLPYGALFPVIMLALSLCDGASALPASELLLPWTLSAVHLAIVLALLVLVPVVHRFQALRSDLLPTSGLPAAFFSLSVIGEMRRRLSLSLACTSSDWDHECCVCCCAITPEASAALMRHATRSRSRPPRAASHRLARVSRKSPRESARVRKSACFPGQFTGQGPCALTPPIVAGTLRRAPTSSGRADTSSTATASPHGCASGRAARSAGLLPTSIS